ncbi:MAG: hypothetical protein FD136_2021, partial [Chitinophagaceae bacterium]
MKKNLLLIFYCLLFNVTNGQITLTETDIKQTGVIFKIAYDTLNLGTATHGNSGVSQTWDFSTLVPSFNDEVRILNRKTAPYNNKFPDANAVMAWNENNTPLYAFVKVDSNYFINQGIGFPEDWNYGPFDLVPQDTIFSFPVNYLDTWSGKYAYETYQNGDTLKTKYTTVKYDTVDAWGNIITPDTTLSALRVKSVEYKYDTVFYNIGGGNWAPIQTSLLKETKYDWWVKDLGYPILELTLDSIGSLSEIKYVTNKFSNVPMPYFGYDVNNMDVQFHDSTVNTANVYLWY